MPSPLAYIYSTADSFKRSLLDMLSNPVESAQQIVGNANDRAGVLNRLTAEAAQEGRNGGPLFGPKSQQLSGLLADAYNPVGMFIGPSSKMWNKDMAFEAQKMLKRGVSPQEVWQATRTARGPDGQLRQEISMAGSEFLPASGTRRMAKNVLRSDNLYKAYPELASIPVRQGSKDRSKYGSLEKGKMSITQRGLENDPRSVAIHEMQHGIQDIEGFGAGGNVSMTADMIKNAQLRSESLQDQMDIIQRQIQSGVPDDVLNELTNQYKTLMAGKKMLEPIANMQKYSGYNKLGGEAEARLAESRRNLTDEELTKYFPFEEKSSANPYGYDVNPKSIWNIDQGGNLMRDEEKYQGLLKALGL